MRYVAFYFIKLLTLAFILLILLTIASNVSQWIVLNKELELKTQNNLNGDCFPVYDASEPGNYHFVNPCEVKR